MSDNHVGIPDGIPDWVDRLEAAGNAQVPVVAARAWEELTRDLRGLEWSETSRETC